MGFERDAGHRAGMPPAGCEDRAMTRPRAFRVLVALALVLGLCVSAGESLAQGDWHKLEFTHTIIMYRNEAVLDVFDKAMDFDPGRWDASRDYSISRSDSAQARAGKKVDSLYERAQTILDMRKKMKKITLYLHEDADDLRATYKEIYGKSTKFRAWYIFEKNSIYLNVEDCHPGMVAHEMAHSIIDHFLLVRPPENSAEILAMYVDSHLFK